MATAATSTTAAKRTVVKKPTERRTNSFQLQNKGLGQFPPFAKPSPPEDQPAAVRVYTVCDESKYLIVRNVLALGCGDDCGNCFKDSGLGTELWIYALYNGLNPSFFAAVKAKGKKSVMIHLHQNLTVVAQNSSRTKTDTGLLSSVQLLVRHFRRNRFSVLQFSVRHLTRDMSPVKGSRFSGLVVDHVNPPQSPSHVDSKITHQTLNAQLVRFEWKHVTIYVYIYLGDLYEANLDHKSKLVEHRDQRPSTDHQPPSHHSGMPIPKSKWRPESQGADEIVRGFRVVEELDMDVANLREEDVRGRVFGVRKDVCDLN
ncbi:hypothetical protein LXL04_039836 [Taraxacum kok-saghyz]